MPIELKMPALSPTMESQEKNIHVMDFIFNIVLNLMVSFCIPAWHIRARD